MTEIVSRIEMTIKYDTMPSSFSRIKDFFRSVLSQ
jgi:hypothetical protein